MTKAQKRRKARQDSKAQKRADKLLRQQSRQDSRLARKTTKADMKLAKNLQNNDRKMFNNQNRQDTKSVAYSMGIDPNAWIADSVGSVSDAVVGVVQAQNPTSGLFGGNSNLDLNTPSGSLSSTSSGGMGMIAVIGAILLFMFKK